MDFWRSPVPVSSRSSSKVLGNVIPVFGSTTCRHTCEIPYMRLSANINKIQSSTTKQFCNDCLNSPKPPKADMVRNVSTPTCNILDCNQHIIAPHSYACRMLDKNVTEECFFTLYFYVTPSVRVAPLCKTILIVETQIIDLIDPNNNVLPQYL